MCDRWTPTQSVLPESGSAGILDTESGSRDAGVTEEVLNVDVGGPGFSLASIDKKSLPKLFITGR